jgi:putative spermidine/putrescine transport system permease protein
VLPITIYTEFTNYANFSIAAALSLVLGVITWAARAFVRTLAGSTVAAAA